MGDGFYTTGHRPNQQYQSTEGTNSTQTNQTYNKQTSTQNREQVVQSTII